MQMLNKKELKEGLTLEECISMLCKPGLSSGEIKESSKDNRSSNQPTGEGWIVSFLGSGYCSMTSDNGKLICSPRQRVQGAALRSPMATYYVRVTLESTQSGKNEFSVDPLDVKIVDTAGRSYSATKILLDTTRYVVSEGKDFPTLINGTITTGPSFGNGPKLTVEVENRMETRWVIRCTEQCRQNYALFFELPADAIAKELSLPGLTHLDFRVRESWEDP